MSLSQTVSVGFENIQIGEQRYQEHGLTTMVAPGFSFDRRKGSSWGDDDDDFIPSQRRASNISKKASTAVSAAASTKVSNQAPVVIELLSPTPKKGPRMSYGHNSAEIVYSPISSSTKTNEQPDSGYNNSFIDSYNFALSPHWSTRENVGRVSEETVILELDDPWGNENNSCGMKGDISYQNKDIDVVDLTDRRIRKPFLFLPIHQHD